MVRRSGRAPGGGGMGDEPTLDQLITCDVRDDAVAVVTINDPANGNALTSDMRDHLAATFDRLAGSLLVRSIVLTGAGPKHFCTGANLRGARVEDSDRPSDAPERAGGEVARMVRMGWQNLIRSILDCDKPVVGAANGTAAGGGANLLLACDLVVMAESARLIEVFVRRGIMPDAGGAYLLPRIVG